MISWIRSVWINWIAWNKKKFWQFNCVLMLNWTVWNKTISIKMDLVLNKLQRLICYKTQTTNQQSYFLHHLMTLWCYFCIRSPLKGASAHIYFSSWVICGYCFFFKFFFISDKFFSKQLQRCLLDAYLQ